MERDIFDTIIEKDFHQLTVTEREELSELCSNEAEFEQLKLMLGGVEVLKADVYTPREETKQKLDDLFAQTHPKLAPIWYNSVLAIVVPKDKPIYRQPLAQIAALLLIAFLAVPFMNNHLDKPDTTLAQVDEDIVESKPEISSENPVSEIKEDDVQTVSSGTDSDQISPARIEVEEELIPLSMPDPRPFMPTDGNVSTSATTFTMFDAAADEIIVSNHPDGVFVGEIVEYSIPASDEPELFDLLTATF